MLFCTFCYVWVAIYSVPFALCTLNSSEEEDRRSSSPFSALRIDLSALLINSSLALRFSEQNVTYMPHLSRECYVLHPSYPYLSDHSINSTR